MIQMEQWHERVLAPQKKGNRLLLRTGVGVSVSEGVPDAGSPAVLRRRAFPLDPDGPPHRSMSTIVLAIPPRMNVSVMVLT